MLIVIKLFGRIIVGFCCIILVQSTVFAAESLNNIVIRKGSIINGVLITPVSSKVNKVGDSVIFKTEKNITADGVIIIPKGTVGRAVVTRADKAGYFGTSGTIAFIPKYVYAVNGIEIPLTFEQVKSQNDEQSANTAVQVIGFGFFAGFFHGQNQKMPIGTKFSMWVAKDTDLEMNASEIENKYY